MLGGVYWAAARSSYGTRSRTLSPTVQEEMMAVDSSLIGREAGRGLLSLANLITLVAPAVADWNESHILNQRWPSHARFHGVTSLAMTSSLAGVNLWSLWSPSTDRRTSRVFAAAVPIGYWAPFFVALLVPGTGVDDPPHRVPRVAGVPASLLGAAATSLTAVAGWVLDRRAD
jgi:hypothetical protein